MKTVSVLIPTYNHGSVVTYQIEAVLRQTLPPKRIVVLDDGSTDNTLDVLDRYRENESVKIIRQPQNRGVHAATTLLLNEVDTDFFAFAAADDVLTRDWCATMTALLETCDSAKMAISNSYIVDDGQLSVTDSIPTVDGRTEGFYEPRQYVALLTRHGRLPPSNTILYRSDIIEEIVRPVFSRKELISLTDVLLILAIATKYPIAYSTAATGVCVRSRHSYGHSFFNRDDLRVLIANVECFATRDRYITCNKARRFIIRYARYSWAKQMTINRVRAVRAQHQGLGHLVRAWSSYFKLLLAFIVNRRFRFVRLRRARKYGMSQELGTVLDKSVLERFYSA